MTIRLRDLISENWQDGDSIKFIKNLGGIFSKFDKYNYWPKKGDEFKLKRYINDEFELIPIGEIRPETKVKHNQDGIGLTTKQLNRFLNKKIIKRQ